MSANELIVITFLKQHWTQSKHFLKFHIYVSLFCYIYKTITSIH